MPMNDWEKFKRLKAACKRAMLDVREVIVECRDGRSQFFDVPGACCVTAITVSGAHRLLTVTVLGGSLAAIPELERLVTAFAKEHGCDSIRVVGRPGFSAVYEDLGTGWKPIGVLYEKVIEG